MKSQIAWFLGRVDITLIPATQFSGMIDPVALRWKDRKMDRRDLPDQSFSTIARGRFPKRWIRPILAAIYAVTGIAVPVVMGLEHSAAEKQEG